ncbi:MAG: DoxX family protein [Minisyncoccia bacterium]
MTRPQAGLLVLRLGLAGVFLWFGFSQLIDGISWVSWVPEWAVNVIHLPPAMIVLANGLFEVIFGTLLALGLWTRFAAFVLALHLVVIAFDIGLTAIGVRDFGLTLATLALALLTEGKQKPREDEIRADR